MLAEVSFFSLRDFCECGGGGVPLMSSGAGVEWLLHGSTFYCMQQEREGSERSVLK